jgi:hypothetical protein
MELFLGIAHLLRVHLRVALAFIVAVGVVFVARVPAHAQIDAQAKNAVVSAKVTSVETNLGGNGWHYLTTTVHLQNLTRQPLILGVESGKVTSTDDRGNTYGVLSVRGIGQIAGAKVDTKFVLPAEGGGDALFQMRWRGDRNAVFGTVFDLKLPLRVIVPLEAGQFKLGMEHLLTFTGLKAGYVATLKTVPALPANTVNAGPFTVQITRLTPSIAGNRRTQSVTLVARIKNTSDKPLILAYEGSSSFGVDDQGNAFAFGTAGTHDTSVSGIGMVAGSSADPQFELGPGEARDVQFTVWRRLGREVAGTQLTYYVALVQLEVLPSKQVRTVRQYSLTFPRIAGLNK